MSLSYFMIVFIVGACWFLIGYTLGREAGVREGQEEK